MQRCQFFDPISLAEESCCYAKRGPCTDHPRLMLKRRQAPPKTPTIRVLEVLGGAVRYYAAMRSSPQIVGAGAGNVSPST